MGLLQISLAKLANNLWPPKEKKHAIVLLNSVRSQLSVSLRMYSKIEPRLPEKALSFTPTENTVDLSKEKGG